MRRVTTASWTLESGMAPEKAPLRVVLCFYPGQPQDDIALGLAQRAWPSAFLRFPTVHRLGSEGRLRVVLPGRHEVDPGFGTSG